MTTDTFARIMAGKAKNLADPLASATYGPNRVRRIAIIGDSFVGGAGSSPNTFGIPFSSALRARYGDAGAGYIPFIDGNMAGIARSSNFQTVAYNGGAVASSYYRWDADARKKLMFNGLGYYRDGGVGDVDGSEYLGYTPNTADNFSRGVADTWSRIKVYFTLRSANAGFLLRQSDANTLFYSEAYGSGASFTASQSALTMTASSVTGVIPRTGVRAYGGTAALSSVTYGGGSNRGGAGTYGMNTSQTVTSSSWVADPNISTTLNIPQCVTFRRNTSYNTALQVLGVYGDIVFSGVEHFTGDAGVTISNFGVGGTTAVQWASLDDASQRRFWQLTDFDLVLVVLGMNDRLATTPGHYGTAISTIVSQIQSNPKTRVMLVRQTDASDFATSNQQYFTGVLQDVASAMGCAYADMRDASSELATYTAANAAGHMTDTVHLGPTGNTLVGNYLASMVNF